MLGPLYHWSPRCRRDSILDHGLQVDTDVTVSREHPKAVCLSPDPLTAWELSGELLSEHSIWDLWQIRVDASDEVHVLPCWGSEVMEIRIRNNIHPDRVTWIGERIHG